MFKFWKPRNDGLTVDNAIDRLLVEMNTFDPDTPEYKAAVTHLQALMKVQAETRKPRVSPDTWVLVAGNILVVLVVVGFEQKNVITTKALSFVTRPG